MKQYQTAFRDISIETGALKTGEFTLKSGRPSCYFFNLASAMNSGKGLSVVSGCYSDMIQESLDDGRDFDFLMGPAYKGIPLAATIAQELAKRGINKRYGFDIKEDPSISVSTEDIISGLGNIEVVDTLELDEMPMDGRHAREFAEHYANMITGNYDFDSVLGQAYGGIAPTAIVLKEIFESLGSDKRWAYNRKGEKAYGDKTELKLVGDLREGDRVLFMKSREEPWTTIAGDLRDNDIVSQSEDVITTGRTKIEAWEKIEQKRHNLIPGVIYLGLNRQETTETGESPMRVVEDAGWEVRSILEARPLFKSLHNREVGGRVLVDDDTLRSFEEYQKKYGV